MGTEKKVVIDTNNLISALGWDGKSRELFEKAVDGKVEWFISLQQIRELGRVLDYPKFEFSEEQKRRFLKIIFEIADIIQTRIKLDVVKEDPDDNMIIECAVECDADYIISGNKHLLKLKRYGDTEIVTVREFLEKHF